MTINTTPTATRPTIRPLTAGWSVTATAGPVAEAVRGVTVPATVPGSVHTDLLAAGLIPDPYLDNNEALLGWIGLCDWHYTTTFSWTPDAAAATDRAELVFGGLDTVATVAVNGTVVGSTRNMHRSYRFDVSAVLRPGDNELTVSFSSPVKAADAASLELGYRPHVNHHPFNALRKMAASFGWDWGIDTATSGIWKDVTLESWSTARLAGVRPIATVEQGGGTAGAGDAGVTTGVVTVHVEVARVTDEPLRVAATVAGIAGTAEIAAGATAGTVTVRVPDAALWWPRGYGEQPLYDVEVTLAATASPETLLDVASRHIGFRTVRFETTPDASGTPFTIVINDQPVFIKGANWIPDDAFPHRVDRARYRRRLEQAEFANINLIRVWGGGIYESDDFYELCDELGLLTWQDFLFACAAYAEEEPMRSEVEAEAREAVARLAPHPSLVVLNGNNENIWGYEEWNWKLRLDGNTWGAGYYYELFPSIVAELAPHVGYTPGSPFSPAPVAERGEGRGAHHPNDPDNGTMHIWDLWNQTDYPHYRDYTPRFVSEFGWQGPPTWSTMTTSIADFPLTPESPGMLVHQKAAEGNVKLTDGLLPHLKLPNEIAAWHWAMSLNQAVAITTAIEHFRSLQPHCMGSIVWQLNDCWPVTSWAAVDGYERPKPLLYALRHAYADRLLTVQPRGTGPSVSGGDGAGVGPDADGSLAVIAVNDTAEEWAGDLVTRRLNFEGSSLAEHTETVVIPARSSVTVTLPSEISRAADATAELIRAELTGVRGNWFFAEYRNSALAAARLHTELTPTGGGYTLKVTARTLVRDLTVLVDRLDPEARVSDMLVTLLPGESVDLAITTDTTLDLTAVTAPTVLRSANQLVAS